MSWMRTGLTMVTALGALTAQTPSESSSADRRFQAAQSTPEGVKAAEKAMANWARGK